MALASLCHEVTANSKAFGSSAKSDYFCHIDTSFTAFIVDHKLRKNSGEEAKSVAAELARLDIPSKILEFDWFKKYRDPSKLSNIESIARRLRYRLLGRACRDHGIESLLVAHHADDEAETVLSRIVTSHTGTGLSGIRAESPIPECDGIYGVDHSGDPWSLRGREKKRNILIEGGGVNICRPLLPFRKEQLIATCQQNGVRWFEDHTNSDPTLTLRNTVRFMQKTNVLPEALRVDRLSKLSAKISSNRDQLDAAVLQLLKTQPLSLDLRSGEAEYILPKPAVTANDAVHAVQASLLRKLLELVTPQRTISLQDLDQAVDYVFHKSDIVEAERNPNSSEQLQIAGVNIQLRLIEGVPTATFRRAIPTKQEGESKKIRLWPPPWREDSSWHLWDNRYWIRILPPPRAPENGSTITLEFLTGHTLSEGRKSCCTLETKRDLRSYLNLVNGTFRFTLPAIVKHSKAQQRRDSGEIVALPSLGWSQDGWQRYDRSLTGEVRLNDKHWLWDVRYKHVELTNSTEKLSTFEWAPRFERQFEEVRGLDLER